MKTLLDSPKWYKVRDKKGYDLLYITILKESKEVFDYLLSLPDFPVEAHLEKFMDMIIVFAREREYYLFELINRETNIDRISKRGNSYLHSAMQHRMIRFAKYLITERGIDVNAQNSQGQTPLHLSHFFRGQDQNEAICMLLWHGAEPFISDDDGRIPLEVFLNENQICSSGNPSIGHENLIYFTVDRWSDCKIPASFFLFNIPKEESSRFERWKAYYSRAKRSRRDVEGSHVDYLFVMCLERLESLLERVPSLVEHILRSHEVFDHKSVSQGVNCKWLSLQNFDTIIRALGAPLLIDLISKISSTVLISNLIFNSHKPNNEIVEIIVYLLSYGMSLSEMGFEIIYEKLTGYNDDFRILLHMAPKEFNVSIFGIMPRLIFDINLDVEGIVQDTSLCIRMDWNTLFGYFAHFKLQMAYERIKGQKFSKDLPQLPSLQELARDEFRQHFIKTFRIQTASQFFTLIKSLPISPVHKKIITFETKLYNQ